MRSFITKVFILFGLFEIFPRPVFPFLEYDFSHLKDYSKKRKSKGDKHRKSKDKFNF